MIAWETVFPFWNSLSDLQQTEILDCIIIRQYSEGERIKKRQGLYIVDEGGLALYVNHDNGRKRILLAARIRSEVILLTKEFLTASHNISLELRTTKDSEIYFIPEEGWNALIKKSSDVQKYTFDVLSQHLVALSQTLYEGLENIGSQLAKFLLRRCEILNSTEIETSHEELAEALGTTREVITRNISQLKSIGLLETGRNKIWITDLEGIKKYVQY